MTAIIPINSRDGNIYWVEEGDTLYIERLKHGQYQKTNWLFAQKLIDNWTRCLDVGTNNACNAIHYAQRFKQVECFEPTPLAQQLWTNTIRDNVITNCQLYPVALGDKPGTTEVVIHYKNGGHNYLNNANYPQWTGRVWVPRKPQTLTNLSTSVNVETIDSYQFSDVGFIKIDVEGYEKFVLLGAEQLILQCRPTIQIELVARQCRQFGYMAEDIIDWIRARDYTIVSKRRGNLYGRFQSYRNELRYDGIRYRGEMDLWLQPTERVRHTQLEKLFEMEHG
jgi:FkbM family methyltransferase